MSHESVTESYPVTIPVSALRGSKGQYYVLVIRETRTILGDESRAEKMEVSLIAQDGKRAVVSEAIGQTVITQSSKPISDGDRVREVSGL